MADVPRIADRLEDLRVKLETVSQPRRIDFQPSEDVRATMAKTVGLIALPRFAAEVEVRPWLDGVEIVGDWRCEVVQTCGLSLEDFSTDLTGRFDVRALPAESPHRPEVSKEVVIEAEGEDPPDVLDGETLDLGDYILEHLSLELDPFPRKPGALFEPPAEEQLTSPFASLKGKIS